jgi:hypothetical protein
LVSEYLELSKFSSAFSHLHLSPNQHEQQSTCST